jgi:hypothetical protein
MSLNDSVHRLTRPHLTHSGDGSLQQMPALLAELRLAVTPGQNGYGGGASGPPIPIDPAALDLIRAIESEARRDYAEAIGKYWTGTLETLLQAYPDAPISAEWEAYLEGVTLGWVDQITSMLWPVKPRRKLTGKTCPACGLALHGDERAVCLSLGCWDDDGNLAKIGEWDIECAGCGAEWAGDQVAWLLRALDTPVDDVVHVG